LPERGKLSINAPFNRETIGSSEEARVGSQLADAIVCQFLWIFSSEVLNGTELSRRRIVAVYLVCSQEVMRELEAGVGIGLFSPPLQFKYA